VAHNLGTLKKNTVMRTGIYIIVWCTIISSAIVFSQAAFSQETKLTKEQKKELRKQEREESFRAIDSLITSRLFVLEADFLQGKLGERVFVNSTLNFVRVVFNDGTLQVGNITGAGFNGVGGVTAQGEIRSWQMVRNMKNRTITVRFTIDSAIGHYDILLIASGDNPASATITGLGPGQLTWIGKLKPVQASRVFKGQTNY